MKLVRDFARDEIAAVAGELLDRASRLPATAAAVLALHGDLGAGKTTLVQALGRHLGINDGITSPTFTIMKGYETTSERFVQLIHMDAYRIDDVAELGPLHFAEILATPNTLFCVEWAEKIADALPEGVIQATLTTLDEHSRRLEVD